jgi:hypothetical protein
MDKKAEANIKPHNILKDYHLWDNILKASRLQIPFFKR